jgi:hypothetical protein
MRESDDKGRGDHGQIPRDGTRKQEERCSLKPDEISKKQQMENIRRRAIIAVATGKDGVREG